MKKIKLTDMLHKGNPIGGITRTSYPTNKITTRPLTLKKLQKMYDYLQSDEYHEKVATIHYQKALANNLVNTAFMEKVINEFEWIQLLHGIEINGALFVNISMYERLLPIATRIEKQR